MLHQVKEALRVKMANNEYVTLVHDATNEDPWGPTGPQMDDIARVFHNGHEEIMEELTLRLKNRKDSWRMCYKSMLVLDHLARNVHESSLPIIMPVAPLLRQISTTYTCNEKNIDRGLSVRERARKLADLLTDGGLLQEERQKADQTRRKVAGEPISMGSAATSAAPASRGPSAAGHSHPSARAGNGAGNFPRTSLKQEQEQADMILAMRLQTEEDRRAQASGQTVVDHGPILVGRTVKSQQNNATTASSHNRNMPRYPAPTSQEEADHFLALEMQRRIDNNEPMTPTVFEQLSFKGTTPPPPAGAGAQPTGAKPAGGGTLDDLFSFGNGTQQQPQPQPQAQQPLDATSLFQTQPSASPKTSAAAAQPASFDPFAAPSPPSQSGASANNRNNAGETDFFDNFLAQRKDLHKSPAQPQQQQQQAPPPSSDSRGIDLFGSSAGTATSSATVEVTTATGVTDSKPNGTDLFELQMQRLSTSNNNDAQNRARGMTLDDMLRDGKAF